MDRISEKELHNDDIYMTTRQIHHNKNQTSTFQDEENFDLIS